MSSNSASPFTDLPHRTRNNSTHLCRGFASLKRMLGLPFLVMVLGLAILFGSTAVVRSQESPQNPANNVNKPPKKKAKQVAGKKASQGQDRIAKQDRDRRIDQLRRKFEALIQAFLKFEAEARAKRPRRGDDDGGDDDDGDDDDGDDDDDDDD